MIMPSARSLSATLYLGVGAYGLVNTVGFGDGPDQGEMGAFDFGGVQLFVEEHSEVSGPTKEPARCIINLNAPGYQPSRCSL